MRKIVELLVDMTDVDFEGVVDIMSLVDKPAIGIEWLAFAEDCEECFDDLEDACKPGYVAYGLKPKGGRMVPNCVPVEASMQFESYTDYPEAVKEAAARGIRLNEEVNNKCATQVGKVRAQQLANGEAISEETIRRMYSYLSRAKEYYNPDDTEACGTISYLLWGGEPALGWSERKIAQLDREREEMMLLQLAEEHGEYINDDAILIDATKQEFSTLEEIGKGIKGLELLTKYVKKGGEPQQRYRYAGPKDSNTRGLCRKLLSVNKLYTIQDLRAMSGALSVFGATRNGRPYSVFQFKGGKNCRHAWHSVTLFNLEGKTIMMDRGPVTQENTMDNLRAGEAANAGQVAGPSNNWWGMAEQQFRVVSEDQQILVGPAMVPSMLIPRRDAEGNEFFVYFSKETIKKIAAKFMAEGYLHNTDVNHDMNVTTENTLLESWIIEDPEMDKAKKYGYDLPEGSWMVSYKINNPDTWAKIKNGELNGYSIAGTFIERMAK